MTILRTLPVQMQPTDALQYIKHVDDTGQPWQLVGTAYTPNIMQLFIDGEDEPVEITLNPDGTWSATLTVYVPVQ